MKNNQDRKKIFLQIYIFFLVFLLAVSLGRGFFSLWFSQNNFSYQQIFGYYLIKLAIPSILLVFIKRFSSPKSFIIAFASEIILMLGVIKFIHPWQIFLIGIPSGITVVFFYVTYNTLYFNNTPKNKRAFSSSIFTLAGPFLGIAVPLIVGFIGKFWGLQAVFPTAIFIILIAAYLTKNLPKISFACNLKKSLNKTKKINLLLIIEGIREAVGLAAVPVFTLLFINQPLPYGVFFSYLAFVSVGTTLLLGHLSDKSKKRTIILYPSTILVALLIMTLGFSQDLRSWAILTGCLGLVSTINGTFVTTLVLDQINSVGHGMIGREFLLGVGRIIGSLIFIASLAIFSAPKSAFLLIGLIYLLFPYLVFRNKLYVQKTK
ncbi:MAG: MFS transporter [Candidatus Shapirobacteria bacterium]